MAGHKHNILRNLPCIQCGNNDISIAWGVDEYTGVRHYHRYRGCLNTSEVPGLRLCEGDPYLLYFIDFSKASLLRVRSFLEFCV